ncbi:MAG TPA: hypothetical protein VFI37_06785 [Gaiellaceae bacterium]|nr:hypothetical protein [Gaiellaceae bacterium]
MASDGQIRIDDLLRGEYGLSPADAALARAALEQARLTNPRKQAISLEKLERVQDVLAERLQLLCAACATAAASDHRPLLAVRPEHCERCAGSHNRRAVRELVAACAATGVRRLVFVGGSPSFRQELGRLVDGRLELRLVDGTRRATKAGAQQDIAWADVVVVCGATELSHKVSNLYTDEPAARRKLVQTRRRGIEAIADEVARSDAVARHGG